MATSVKIMATLVARPGKVDELRGLLLAMIAPSRAESGNLRWDIWQDRAQSDRFVLDELYVDTDAVTAHRQTPHFAEYVARINDLAERSAFVLDAVDVA